jgi:hypothetical protein
MTEDHTAVGAAYRVEAEKSKHRAIALAVVLVLAHLLDVRPSEIEGLGLKVTLRDPVVLYGFIAMVFGYYLSRFLSDNEKGEALNPLTVEKKRVRSNLLAAQKMYRADKKKRRSPQTPAALKKSAKELIIISNLILLPYRLIAAFFLIAAIVFTMVDIIGLAMTIWNSSHLISEFTNSL